MAGAVFISYSSSDRAYVDKLGGHLMAAGLPIWYDYQIMTGDRFDKVIAREIDACAAFIVVMTPRSDDSDWVANEVAHAREKGKPILPLLLEGSAFMSLKSLDYEPVAPGRMPSRDFVDHLRSLVVAGTVARATPMPPTTVPTGPRLPQAPQSPIASGTPAPAPPSAPPIPPWAPEPPARSPTSPSGPFTGSRPTTVERFDKRQKTAAVLRRIVLIMVLAGVGLFFGFDGWSYYTKGKLIEVWVPIAVVIATATGIFLLARNMYRASRS